MQMQNNQIYFTCSEPIYSHDQFNHSSDIFHSNQIIHEPEYFLNISDNTQQQCQNLPQEQTLEDFSLQRPHENLLNFSFDNKQDNQPCFLFNIDQYPQQDNLIMSQHMISSSFNQPKDDDQCITSNLEQQFPQSFQESFQSLKEIESKEQNSKKYKNQNILKDIFNSFHKYVKSLTCFPNKEFQSVNIQDIKKKYNRFIKIHTFNNSLIKYVLTHKYYKLLFIEYFEKGNLHQWVQKSRVSNKDGLNYWVNILIESTKNPSVLENLIENPQPKSKNKNI